MTRQPSEFAQDVLRLTNEFRAEHGLSPLTMNEKLAVTAQKYSQTMAEDDFFSHIGEDSSNPWDRAEVEGYTARAVGENIAAGQGTPEQVVQGWISSAGHRQNLLNPNYTELGVGYFELKNDTGQVNYYRYWTQLFGSGDLTANNAVIVSAAAESAQQTPATAETVASSSIDHGSNSFGEEVLQLTNAFRLQNGLSPLVMNSELAVTAQKHSRAMAEEDFFDHIGPNGSKPWDRAEAAGYTARAIGENIAAGQPTPEQVVQSWINSPGHRENLLNPSYIELGVGYFQLANDTGRVNYSHYWTQVFGSGDLTPGRPTAETTDSLFTTGQIGDILIKVLTINEEGTVQLSDRLSYRLDAAPEKSLDSQRLFVGGMGSRESIAFIQVDSDSTLADGGLMVA